MLGLMCAALRRRRSCKLCTSMLQELPKMPLGLGLSPSPSPSLFPSWKALSGGEGNFRNPPRRGRA